MSEKTFDLVIARFQENRDWQKNIPSFYNVIEYNKGKGRVKNRLANIGREANTYLHHIVKNYDKLADITVFSQGNPFDHVPDFLVKLNDEVPKQEQYYNFGCSRTKSYLYDNVVSRYGNKVWDWFKPATLNKIFKKYDFLQYNKQKKENGKVMIWASHFAIFSVPRESIQFYTKEFWQELLELSVEYDVEGAYMFELLWETIMANKPVLSKYIAEKPKN